MPVTEERLKEIEKELKTPNFKMSTDCIDMVIDLLKEIKRLRIEIKNIEDAN